MVTQGFGDSGRATAGLVVIAAGLLWLPCVAAQESGTVEVTPSAGSGAETTEAQRAAGPIEEVIVTGQRTIGSLISEGAQLTEEFYDRLNEVLDNDDFRINCNNEYPTGSRIPTRVCRTRFQERLLNQQSVSFIQGLGSTEEGLPVFDGTVADIRPQMLQMTREFEDAMLVAVNADPVLNQQVIRLIALKSAVENYETPRQQRRRAESE